MFIYLVCWFCLSLIHWFNYFYIYLPYNNINVNVLIACYPFFMYIWHVYHRTTLIKVITPNLGSCLSWPRRQKCSLMLALFYPGARMWLVESKNWIFTKYMFSAIKCFWLRYSLITPEVGSCFSWRPEQKCSFMLVLFYSVARNIVSWVKKLNFTKYMFFRH